MGTPKSTAKSAYANLPLVSGGDTDAYQKKALGKLYTAGQQADAEAAGATSTATIGNLSQDSLDELGKKVSPGPGNLGASPDMTDDLVRQAREYQLLNIKAKRGQSSTFLTGGMLGAAPT